MEESEGVEIDKPVVEASTEMKVMIEALAGKEDRYKGIIVKDNLLPDSVDEFISRMTYSLQVWKEAKKKGIWLKLPINKAEFVKPAVDLGFVYHSAEKEYVVLNKWLSHYPNSLPHNATHQVGVGCVVINSNGEMLLVQERSGILKGLGIWKIPTGLSDPGEDIPMAAVREVLEETGVRVKFSHILNFRQLHNLFLGKSDLFFVCVMELEDENNTEVTAQASEIEACGWMDPEVYFNQKFMQTSEAHRQLNLGIEAWLKTKRYPNREKKEEEKKEEACGEEGEMVIEVACDGESGVVSAEETVVASGNVPCIPVITCNYYPSGFKPGDSAIYTIV